MPSKTILFLCTSIVALTVLAPKAAVAETVSWSFSIDEQSIRNGPESDGSTNSPGMGAGTVDLDLDTNIISIDLSWSGLVGELTKLHIHGPAGIDKSNPQHLIEIFGPPEVPADLVATEGSWSATFELESLSQPNFDIVTPEFVVETMLNGEAYVNVHTTVFGTGEIRGNLGTPVPEPGSHGLLAFGAVAVLLTVRRKKRS